MTSGKGNLGFRKQELVSDLADKASQTLERELEGALTSMRWQEERQAQIAENRRRCGKDGVCLDCNKPIEQKRLEATKGEAIRCRPCEEAFELQRERSRGSRAVF